MRAQILSINSIARPDVHAWEQEAMLSGFTKALALVKSLQLANWREAQTAIENWVRCGKLTREEADVLYGYFGWEKLPS